MCGIAGIFFKKNTDQGILNRFEQLVKEKQFQRGPDDFNKLEVAPGLYFFHNMLSIIDIGNASQPMQDERGAITYNGEVYNYRDLKFSTERYEKKSDTEVLLKGLNVEYIDFLKKTNSMFGFGYYNRQNKMITLCRDRIGIKPVYFINTPEVFAFASTITPLAMFSAKRLNHSKLWQFYLNRAFKAPDTIFDDVLELPSGSYLEFDTKSSSISPIKKWWERKPVEEIYTNEDETVDAIEQLMKDAIRNRLVADVPVGLFLSGGVDSSLVAALTSQQTSNLNAFTVAFHDAAYDESPYAKSVCKKYNIGYNEIRVDAGDFLNNITNWIEIQDDIVADPSALLLYKISEYASSKNYRVLLAGEGSDELFAGYNSYKYFNWSKRIYNNGGKLLPFKKAMLSFYKDDSKKYNFLHNAIHKPVFYGTAMIFEPHLLNEMIGSFSTEKASKAYDLKHAMDLDIKDRLPNDVLTRSDRSTSGTKVELRVPFLAHQLVDFSAGISRDLLMKNKTPKYLIKKLASRYLDQDLIYRKKVGFDLPIGQWLSGELKGMLNDAMDNSVQKDMINVDTVRKCFSLHTEKGIDHASKLWAFLCVELSYKYLSQVR
ncbi:MAG: asparagine synthase (glutamine-hydrolyzing) [Ferruginibacter sp.]